MSLFGEELKLEKEIRGAFLMLNNKCSKCTENLIKEKIDPEGWQRRIMHIFL